MGKTYAMETQKGLLVALEPSMAGFIVVKAAVVNTALCAATCRNLDQAKKAFPKGVANTLFKETCYVTTKSALQLLSVEFLSRRLAHKLMKDVRASALRKVARYHSRATAGLKLLKTGALASLLGHLAVFLVEECVAYYAMLNSSDHDYEMRRASLRKQRVHNFEIMMGSVVLQGVGAAVGTMVNPGRGTFIGGLVGGSVAYLF